MKYIDSGIGEAEQTVAWWMDKFSADGPCEFRCQSGYFTLEGGAVLMAALEEWAHSGSLMRLLLGANQASTLASHVSYLAGRLGLPRPQVGLGIVSFDRGLFHPKVYHFLRPDSSEAAYVGSANFTGPGTSGLNVEAGLILDTREGDDPNILRSIRERIDAWFEKDEAGLSKINTPDDIQRLLEEGYLSLRVAKPPPEAGLDGDLDEGEGGQVGPPRPRRRMLVSLPRLEKGVKLAANEEQVNAPESNKTRRNYNHTEASFHYPQGTHLGHLLAILWRFESGRRGTSFDDGNIRLSGALGTGRIAGFRRQIKYKLLAAMELGLITDVRFADRAMDFIPELTPLGRGLWELISPHIDTAELEMGGGVEYSTTLPQRPTFYNRALKGACDSSPPLAAIYGETMLSMPAVGQMLEFLGEFPEDRVSKNDIYRGYFEFPSVIAFCDEVGIEPQTEESARHRCPFLLNVLESLGKIGQEQSYIVRR